MKIILIAGAAALFIASDIRARARLKRRKMTVIQIIDTFTFYGLDIFALAAVTCALVQILKLTLFKKCKKKLVTLAPFIIGSILYAGYAALVNLSFVFVAKNYVSVLEHGFSVGALSTLMYVWYEQFLRDGKATNATEGVIATLIEGYVPNEAVVKTAAEIANAIERDVTGDGAKKTADILAAIRADDVTDGDVKTLARLIIETLAHMNTL